MSANSETALAYLGAAYRLDHEECRRLIGDGYMWIDRARGVVARTPEELQQATEYDAAWSDRTLEVERVMETTEGTVIVQGKVTGIHTGEWLSIPPTGQRVTFPFCNIFGFDARGRIVSEDTYEDHLSVAVQLGAFDPAHKLGGAPEARLFGAGERDAETVGLDALPGLDDEADGIYYPHAVDKDDEVLAEQTLARLLAACVANGQHHLATLDHPEEGMVIGCTHCHRYWRTHT